MRRDKAEALVSEELTRALTKHRSMASSHEGYAVILEEVDELWDEIKRQNPDVQHLAKEAAQVAAMGLRFLIDLVPGDKDVADLPRPPSSTRVTGSG